MRTPRTITPRAARPVRLVRLVLSGAESTGKTTLAERLAERAGTTWVPEYAREYAVAVGRALVASDVERVARGQMAAEDAAASRVGKSGLLILDTDLVSTTVYSRLYYGSCPAWIDEAALRRLGDLYLFCDVDVPWVPDFPARDRPQDRSRIHSRFEARLRELDAAYVMVRGDWEARWERAVRALDALLTGAGRVATPPSSRPSID
jgi:NadR type nicotinamide-nucleotide adenylyltransferase